MKKIYKLLALVLMSLLVVNLTSCTSDVSDLSYVTFTSESTVGDMSTEEQDFFGYFYFDENNKIGTLYLVGATIPTGKYEPVYLNKNDSGLPSYAHRRNGLQFAGWYPTSDFENGTKFSSLSLAQSDADHIIYSKYITYADAGVVAIVCMVIVFIMLALLWGIVSLFKYIKPKTTDESPATPLVNKVASANVNAQKSVLKLEDIKDDDMMAAALVATIDYHNETNEDVRVVSIKQIG